MYACGSDITIQQQYTHSAETDKKKKTDRRHRRRLVPHPDSGDPTYGTNSLYTQCSEIFTPRIEKLHTKA